MDLHCLFALVLIVFINCEQYQSKKQNYKAGLENDYCVLMQYNDEVGFHRLFCNGEIWYIHSLLGIFLRKMGF